MHYKLSYQLRISNTCSLIRAWSKCNFMRKYFNFNLNLKFIKASLASNWPIWGNTGQDSRCYDAFQTFA